jgi:hypothetical protein
MRRPARVKAFFFVALFVQPTADQRKAQCASYDGQQACTDPISESSYSQHHWQLAEADF